MSVQTTRTHVYISPTIINTTDGPNDGRMFFDSEGRLRCKIEGINYFVIADDTLWVRLSLV